MDATAFGQMLSDAVFDSPIWGEVLFVCVFVLGFTQLHRFRAAHGKSKQAGKLMSKGPTVGESRSALWNSIEAEIAAGRNQLAIKLWRASCNQERTPVAVLKLVVQAFLDAEPEGLHQDISTHLANVGCSSSSCVAVLDVIARSGKTELLEEMEVAFRDRLRLPFTPQIIEVLLGGFAFAGREDRVAELATSKDIVVTVRGRALAIRGLLRNGCLDAAIMQARAMVGEGFVVPSVASTEFYRLACDTGRVSELGDEIRKLVNPTPEAHAFILEYCWAHKDMELADWAQHAFVDIPFGVRAYDALLKLYVTNGDARAITIFKEMQSSRVRIGDGLCCALVARAAESKFLAFAQEVVQFVRGSLKMSVPVYSALMKVYAYSNMFKEACDLYPQILRDGLEPDAVMLSCLCRFAAECGRTELARTLCDRMESLDIQTTMSLLRSATQAKDVPWAFAILEKLKASNVTPDIAAYNCVLDVCANCGNMTRARVLLKEMQQLSGLDIITFNTVLKGFCVHGDIDGAWKFLDEMHAAGFPPNDVSYNSLLNTIVSAGRLRDAWGVIDLMRRQGVPPDHYSISTMLKAVKRNANNSSDVGRVLQLLDQSGCDICSDEVLLNTVLETCVRHKEQQRLRRVLAQFEESPLRRRCAMHTYGTLLRTYSSFGELQKCREVWSTLVQRAGIPSDVVLGCMLDALVCNNATDEAVALLREFKGKVRPNSVMYSTLVKGFASSHRTADALELMKEMRENGVEMSTSMYNSLIDVHSRVGAIDEILSLIDFMSREGCKPDDFTSSLIVKAYCVNGNLSKAFEVFTTMPRTGFEGDTVIFNTILDGCVRHNDMNLADKLLENIDTYHIKPTSFTLGIIVKMWGRCKKLDKAFEAVDMMPAKYGFKLNVPVSTCLMSACLLSDDGDRALQVFDGIRQRGSGADVKAYNSLVSGLVRLGSLKSAVRLVEEAHRLTPEAVRLDQGVFAGQLMDSRVLDDLLRALARAKGTKGGGGADIWETIGAPLLDKLAAHRVPVTFSPTSAVSTSSNTRAAARNGGGRSWS